jgi:hypothetical protein
VYWLASNPNGKLKETQHPSFFTMHTFNPRMINLCNLSLNLRVRVHRDAAKSANEIAIAQLKITFTVTFVMG